MVVSTLAGLALLVAAQTVSARLTVTLVDPSGALLPLALVRLEGPAIASGAVRQIKARGGVAVFGDLEPGEYGVLVSADGFEPARLEGVAVRPGGNEVRIAVKLPRVTEELTVSQGERPTGLITVLTAREIAQLPDDPDELRAVLLRMAGPGAVIRVNGFTAGRIPPKSWIAEIRFRRNPYAADSHELSMVAVEIITRPGASAWSVGLRSGFQLRALNARPGLVETGVAASLHRLSVSVDGPVARDRTSLGISISGQRKNDLRTTSALLPDGSFTAATPSDLDNIEVAARADQSLGRAGLLRAELVRSESDQSALGLAGLDLPERAFSLARSDRSTRVSHTVSVGKGVVSEFRVQYRRTREETIPERREPTLDVLGAFRAGGSNATGTATTKALEVAEDVDFRVGAHNLRSGVWLEDVRFVSDEAINAAGTFTFESREAFVAGRPATFTQWRGDPMVRFRHTRLGAYAHDEFTVTRSVSLGIGLRYERQATLSRAGSLGPRAGFVWTSSLGTVRGGGGRFFDWVDPGVFANTLRFSREGQEEVLITDPGYPDPSGGQALAPRSAISRIERDGRLGMPAFNRLSLDLERPLSARFKLSASYAYDWSDTRLRSVNLNAPGRDGIRPDAEAGNVLQLQSTGYERRHTGVLTASYSTENVWAFAYYILAKDTDEADFPFSVGPSTEPRSERGPSRSDVRQRLFGYADIRAGRRLRVGLQLHGASAEPFNVTTGHNDNGDGLFNDRPQGLGRNSARGRSYLDLSARISWAKALGQSRRVITPTVRRGDPLSLTGGQDGQGGRVRLGFFVQGFNLLNRVNPLGYVGVQASPRFGEPTAAAPTRRIELGASLDF